MPVHFWLEVDFVELDEAAATAMKTTPDDKQHPDILALHDSSRAEAFRGLVSVMDGLRQWTLAHQAAPVQRLADLDFDPSVEFAKASSVAPALRDRIYENCFASTMKFLEVVQVDIGTKASLSTAQLIAEGAKGKKLRMDLVGKETNKHIVRRLNFLAKIKEIFLTMKDDYGKSPDKAQELMKEPHHPQ